MKQVKFKQSVVANKVVYALYQNDAFLQAIIDHREFCDHYAVYRCR